jgi:ABC-2 type transport system ATP-binding protein
MNRPILEIRELRAGYGPRTVLENISIMLAAGDWFVLLGPNGCGKSTLLDCVVSRLMPSGGEICIGGHSLSKNPYEAKLQLGYGCAPDLLPGLLTARQCLEVHAGAKGLTTIGDDLFALADELRFTAYLESFVDTLSLGTRRSMASTRQAHWFSSAIYGRALNGGAARCCWPRIPWISSSTTRIAPES